MSTEVGLEFAAMRRARYESLGIRAPAWVKARRTVMPPRPRKRDNVAPRDIAKARGCTVGEVLRLLEQGWTAEELMTLRRRTT